MKRFEYGASVLKRLSLACLILGGTLSLLACAGSGGGSGGGGISTINGGSAITLAQMAEGATPNGTVAGANAANVAAEVGPSSAPNMQTSMAGGSGVDLGNGAFLQTGSLTVLDGSGNILFTLENGDIKKFTKDGINFVAALKEEAVHYPADTPYSSDGVSRFQGTVTKEVALFLGRLDYSVFGWWNPREILTGTATTSRGRVYLNGLDDPTIENELLALVPTWDPPFYAGESGKEAVPAAGSSFSGVATAVAFHDYPSPSGLGAFRSDQVALLGTATMPVNGGSMPNTLQLQFDNFYNFDAAISVDGSGELTGAFTGIAPNGVNTTGITLDTNIANYVGQINEVAGQFYGSSSSAATEAAGTFHIDKEFDDGHITGVFGAFGVK
jgi:hypothetical protein